MTCANNIEEAVTIAEQRWRGFTFRITGDEAHGPCPICGQATEDGFVIWDNGYFMCRPGGHSGWLDDDQRVKLSTEEIRLRKIEAELRRAARERKEIRRRLTALEEMARCKDHIQYHQNMDEDDIGYWYSQGMTSKSIEEYQLGLCFSCPCDKKHRPSYTIPVFDSAGTLINIRHRLIGAGGGDKYRPHIPGLPGKMLFNSRFVKDTDEILVVEGSKKSIVVSQEYAPAVGILGKGGFSTSWLPHFDHVRRVYVALDPDAEREAHDIARLFGDRGYVVSLPVKADDFFVMGGKPQEFRDFVRLSKRMNA